MRIASCDCRALVAKHAADLQQIRAVLCEETCAAMPEIMPTKIMKSRGLPNSAPAVFKPHLFDRVRRVIDEDVMADERRRLELLQHGDSRGGQVHAAALVILREHYSQALFVEINVGPFQPQ